MEFPRQVDCVTESREDFCGNQKQTNKQANRISYTEGRGMGRGLIKRGSLCLLPHADIQGGTRSHLGNSSAGPSAGEFVHRLRYFPVPIQSGKSKEGLPEP